LNDPSHQRRQRLIGIALMCGAVATFACLDATGKYLLRYMDPLQVVWARYFGAFLLALIFLNPITRPKLITTTRPVMQLGRSALLLLSTGLNFFALRYLQLDEALAILFSTRSWLPCCAFRCLANGSAGGDGPQSASVLWRAPGGAPGFQRASPGCATVVRQCRLLRALCDLDAHTGAQRLQ